MLNLILSLITSVCARVCACVYVCARVCVCGRIILLKWGVMLALSLFHALQWLSDMQFDNVDFVLDSKIVTNVFHANHVDIMEFGQMISACKNHTTTTYFTNSRIEFNRRQANGEAHTIVGVASSVRILCITFCVVDLSLLYGSTVFLQA